MNKLKILLKTILLLSFGFLFAVNAHAENMTDKQINSSVKEKISKNPDLSGYAIDVVTNDGVVTLIGVVDSDKDAGLLIEETQSAPGVSDINVSELKLKNKQHPLEDTIITAKVKGKFIEKELFGKTKLEALGVHVSTKDGTVTLSGKAATQQQIDNAISIAKSVSGVKKVESDIKVE